MKKSISLVAALSLCVVSFGQTSSAPPEHQLRNLNAAQQAEIDAIPANLSGGAAAARIALITASFTEGVTSAELTGLGARLGEAELALGMARAGAIARLQTSGNRLSSSQRSSLLQTASRGGRGGRAGLPGPGASQQTAGRVLAGDSRIGYMGRWDLKPALATTVNSGSRVLFRFRGTSIKGLFQATTAPSQLYVTVDHGERQPYTIDATEIDFAAGGLLSGEHLVELEVKDVSQNANRWTPPLAAALIFAGFDVGTGEALAIEPALTGPWSPNALRIQFFGDSITQGVRVISMATDPSGSDGTRTYAYLTAQAFQANITEVGFGAQAILRGGGGGVPMASESFYYNYAGSLTDPRAAEPDVVVINQGTNDGGAAPGVFEPGYLAYLTRVRLAYPKALIAAMRPFNGSQDAAIYSAVKRMNDSRVIYIDTDGWLQLSNSPDYTEQPTGLHPSQTGHAKAANLLTAALAAAGVPLPRHP